MVVIVEITSVGRNPIKLPSQALLEGFDFGQGRSGNRRKGNVALRKMHQCSVRMIHVERAAGAGFFPLRAEHEVINDELAFAVEEIGESSLAAGGIENVVLFDLDPG